MPRKYINKKPIKLISPDDEVVEIHNIRAFAAEHNMSYDSLRSLSCNRRTNIKGWKSLTYTPRKKFTLFNLDTNESAYIYLKTPKFARSHNLSSSSIGKLVNGHLLRVGPWVNKAVYDLMYRPLFSPEN